MSSWARLAAACVALGFLAACFDQPRVFPDGLVEVPDVTDQRVDEAQQQLEGQGFLTLVVREGTFEEEIDCSAGIVVAQDPEPAEEVLQATTVTLEARDC